MLTNKGRALRLQWRVGNRRKEPMAPGERFNSTTHFLGLLLALAGSGVLLARTWPGGDAGRIAAALSFSLAMVALYAASTLFHSTRGAKKLFWQRADHCAIYLLIAGTYTPFALVTLEGPAGWSLLAGVWTAAAVGIWRELRTPVNTQPSLALYLSMGWLGVIAAVPLAARLDAEGLGWLLAGALFYSVGTVFYRNRWGLRHAHGTWHLFVLAGTASHYAAIAGSVLAP